MLRMHPFGRGGLAVPVRKEIVAMKLRVAVPVVVFLVFSGFTRAQSGPPVAAPEPDSRYKADILLVVGHPDDDTYVSAYLAKVIEQDHKRVAVVHMTRGNSGGNVVGQEQAAALADIREMEARHALASYGVTHVWFLHGTDTPGVDVLHSLEAWGHGLALQEVVRLVRLTRPEVVFTHLPDYVVGENHDDHQAAGVVATEAFDLAADPLAFPEQVEAPRNRLGYSNYGEGLRPWQPRKIYYFTDATHFEFLKGNGPEYPTSDVSPSRKVPYSRVAAEGWSFYKTQGSDYTDAQLRAVTEMPVRLILGKSLVGGARTADVFEGLPNSNVAYARPRGYEPPPAGVTVGLGGPWAFYQAFWRAHNIEHLAELYSPEAQADAGAALWVPLIIRNDTDSPTKVSVRATLPAGWIQKPQPGVYEIGPHDSFTVQLALSPPETQIGTWQTLTWNAESDGKKVGSVSLRVSVSGDAPAQ